MGEIAADAFPFKRYAAPDRLPSAGCIDFGEFGPQQENLRRVVNPEQQHEQAARRAVAVSHQAAAEIERDEIFAQQEQRGGADRAGRSHRAIPDRHPGAPCRSPRTARRPARRRRRSSPSARMPPPIGNTYSIRPPSAVTNAFITSEISSRKPNASTNPRLRSRARTNPQRVKPAASPSRKRSAPSAFPRTRPRR